MLWSTSISLREPAAKFRVIAHPGVADICSGVFVATTKRRASSTESLLAFAVLARERNAA